MENLEKKIQAIINAVPTDTDFLDKGFDRSYTKQIIHDYRLKIVTNVEPKKSLLDQFFESVEYDGFSVFGFNLSSMEEFEDFYQIGFVDVDLIGILKNTGEVVLIDGYSGIIMHYLANDLSSFLDIIPELVKYDMIGYLGESYTNESKKQLLEKLFTIINIDKYHSFYQNRLS